MNKTMTNMNSLIYIDNKQLNFYGKNIFIIIDKNLSILSYAKNIVSVTWINILGSKLKM